MTEDIIRMVKAFFYVAGHGMVLFSVYHFYGWWGILFCVGIGLIVPVTLEELKHHDDF